MFEFGGFPALAAGDAVARENCGDGELAEPFLPGLALLGEEIVETGDGIDATVREKGKVDESGWRVFIGFFRLRLDCLRISS